jgi:hypothetical protein
MEETRSALGAWVMNKEDVGNRYVELMARKYLLQLLKQDRSALLRVMTDVKVAIFDEEAKMMADDLIKRVKK